MKKYSFINILASVLITVFFVVIGILYFKNSYLRLGESLSDLWHCVQYAFCKIFNIHNAPQPTINNYSNIFQPNLPNEFESFVTHANKYFLLLFDNNNFILYCKTVFKAITEGLKIIIIIAPMIFVFIFILKELYNRSNTKHNKDSIPLKVFKSFCKITYYPIKKMIVVYWQFLKTHKIIVVVWAILWLIQLNLVSIIISFFAYVLYFSLTFNVESIYVQFCKLIVDLQVIFKTIPWWAILILGYFFFCRWRKKIALNRLMHMEAMNCGFINALPIVSLTCGSMGKKKTTIITDMALSQEIMFRQKALVLLQENDAKFPNFPWIRFEMDLRRCMYYGSVYNLATIKTWIKKKFDRFVRNGCDKSRIYNYDTSIYPLLYDDGLRQWHLFEILSIYAQLYFIYVIETSLIISNYSIRTSNELYDIGNFPLWQDNLFLDNAHCQTHSHVLDFDILRLGKKVLQKNPNAGSFEFGVISITEIGKERGNNLELKDVRKTKDETNQKNDLFNSWLKMCRHSATVANYPFIKVFADEQRPESWGADARELADVIHVTASGKQKLALPFYFVEQWLCDWMSAKFWTAYTNFRFRRGDNTLLVYVLKSITAWFHNHNERIYNQYGYSIAYIEKERGTLDGKTEKKKYYLLNKKIYNNRFSTDCFSDYFNEVAKKTNVSIIDYPEYASERATVAELKLQNSYFINSLYNNAGSDL